MGYACPVCEDPQADGEHLANHLAFTAMLGDDAHETWLDDHVPAWAEMDPPELAEHVTADAAETEYPQVFEDTTDGADHGHDHADRTADRRGGSDSADTIPADVADVDALDGDDVDAEDVLAEARELTRQRREDVAGDEGDDADEADADE